MQTTTSQTGTHAHTAHIYESFRRIVLENPNAVAMKAQGGLGTVWTRADIEQASRRIAHGLIAKGLMSPIEIGLLSENRPEWGVTYLGILAAGGTVVPIDANLTAEEIKTVISASGIRVLFCSGRFRELLKAIDFGGTVFSFDGDVPDSWKQIMTAAEAELPPPVRTAALIFTSGTTGSPKAVELTHANILHNLEGIKGAFHFDTSDTFLSVLPLHHTFEATAGFLTPLLRGATIVYARSLKSKEILEDIGRNQVTIMCGVPLLYEKMYHAIRRNIENAPLTKRILFGFLYNVSSLGWKLQNKWGKWLFASLRKKAGLGSVRIFMSGGAALPPVVSEFFVFLGFDFMQGYGMTECSPVISCNRAENIQFGSVGQVLDNIEVRIYAPNEEGIGEILVRGGSVTPGYRNNPEATALLLRDGWLHTGDLGKLAKGHLWITGRSKNVIISGAGKNIYPEEIEEKLVESLLIMEAVVFGRKKTQKLGEEVHAVIVPDMESVAAAGVTDTENPDMKKLEAAIKKVVEQVNERIADYKRIDVFTVQLNELEKTSTKKIKRFMYK